MSKLKILVVIFFLFSFSLVVPTSQILAKRLLPQFQTQLPAKTTSGGSGSVKKSVKFRSDRRAIIATFDNLSGAKSVEYSLFYNSRGTSQGAQGTIVSGSSNYEVREILFGTCSKGVCRYDSGISNAYFKVVTVLNSGKKYVKTFRLKV